MHLFHEYLNKYTYFSDEEFRALLKYFRPKQVNKKTYFLEEGQVCNHMAFIVSGAMRKFYIDEKGIEHTVDLYIEDWWVGDRESFVTKCTTGYNILAWEVCDVLCISRPDFLNVRAIFPAFNEFIFKLDEQNNIASQKRITASICLSAEKRLEDFMTQYPYLVKRFPQHIIASYLGFTKDTISRISRRKKLLAK